MSVVEPIKHLLLSHIGAPVSRSLEMFLEMGTPDVTRRALAQPQGYMAQLRRDVDDAGKALRVGQGSAVQAALVAAWQCEQGPWLHPLAECVRALETDGTVLLTHLYLIPHGLVVAVFQLAGKFLPNCFLVSEEVGLALLFETTPLVLSSPYCVQVLRDSAAGRSELAAWTIPHAESRGLKRVALVNAKAYVEAKPTCVTTVTAVAEAGR